MVYLGLVMFHILMMEFVEKHMDTPRDATQNDVLSLKTEAANET